MAPEAFVEHERYSELKELKDWITGCVTFLHQRVRTFPEFELIKSNSYSDHSAAMSAKEFYVSKILLQLSDSSIQLINSASDVVAISYEAPDRELLMISTRNAKSAAAKSHNRLLFELLVTLMHFQNTNEEVYYDHFLLLTELEELLGKFTDEKEFFGKEGTVIQNRINYRRNVILEMENDTPHLSNAWYLKNETIRQSPDERYQRVGSIFKSYRQRFLALEGQLNDFQKLAMGFTYDALYSHSSKSIHYTSSQLLTPEFPDALELSSDVITACFLMVTILEQVAKLNDKTIEGLSESIKNLEEQLGPHLQLMSREFNIGDLVFVEGGLAEVTGELTCRFGYRAYQVKFIDDAPAEPDTSYLAKDLSLVTTKESFFQLAIEKSDMDMKDPEELRQRIETAWPEAGLQYWKAIKGTLERPVIDKRRSRL
jgi:hypothetical protein